MRIERMAVLVTICNSLFLLLIAITVRCLSSEVLAYSTANK